MGGWRLDNAALKTIKICVLCVQHCESKDIHIRVTEHSHASLVYYHGLRVKKCQCNWNFMNSNVGFSASRWLDTVERLVWSNLSCATRLTSRWHWRPFAIAHRLAICPLDRAVSFHIYHWTFVVQLLQFGLCPQFSFQCRLRYHNCADTYEFLKYARPISHSTLQKDSILI